MCGSCISLFPKQTNWRWRSIITAEYKQARYDLPVIAVDTCFTDRPRLSIPPFQRWYVLCIILPADFPDIPTHFSTKLKLTHLAANQLVSGKSCWFQSGGGGTAFSALCLICEIPLE